MAEIPNPYREDPPPAPGNAEVVAGNYLVMAFRALRIRMPYQRDVEAVQRTGELVKRWWRSLTGRKP